MVDETNKNIVSKKSNSSGIQSLISKINNFHILCIYDAKTRMDSRNRKVPIFSGLSEIDYYN